MAMFPPQLMGWLNAQQQMAGQGQVAQAALAPIPGLSGSRTPMPGQMPPMPQQPFTAQGPYGSQAMQMAGLLSPGPKQMGGGLLGRPPRAFRIPLGGK